MFTKQKQYQVTYPKVTIKSKLITVLLNPVTKVTQPLDFVVANYNTIEDYVRELYKEAQLPLPASEASDSQ